MVVETARFVPKSTHEACTASNIRSLKTLFYGRKAHQPIALVGLFSAVSVSGSLALARSFSALLWRYDAKGIDQQFAAVFAKRPWWLLDERMPGRIGKQRRDIFQFDDDHAPDLLDGDGAVVIHETVVANLHESGW